jgi:hypothetical protein
MGKLNTLAIHFKFIPNPLLTAFCSLACIAFRSVTSLRPNLLDSRFIDLDILAIRLQYIQNVLLTELSFFRGMEGRVGRTGGARVGVTTAAVEVPASLLSSFWPVDR